MFRKLVATWRFEISSCEMNTFASLMWSQEHCKIASQKLRYISNSTCSSSYPTFERLIEKNSAANSPLRSAATKSKKKKKRRRETLPLRRVGEEARNETNTRQKNFCSKSQKSQRRVQVSPRSRRERVNSSLKLDAETRGKEEREERPRVKELAGLSFMRVPPRWTTFF